MIEVRHGEALDALRAIPDASIDAVITDPPSGSTLVAAAMEGRQAIGIEREPHYVDVARSRIAHALATLSPEHAAE